MELLHIGFNQDHGCFACGTSTGFRVFNCDPFREQFRREFNNGGIAIVEMLFRCNILAIVGGGTTPKFPPTKVMIWDDDQGRIIAELSFRSQVRAVRLRKDRIVVVQEHKVSVYNFADLKLLHSIETVANLKGLVALSSQADVTVLACPGLHPGKVRVELFDRRQTKFISAHASNLACLSLALDGRFLATASERGTLVRVWSTADGTLLQELRRGSDAAVIYSLSLSKNCEWLAVSSDKGTVHVFALNEALKTGMEEPPRQQANGTREHASSDSQANPTSMLSVVKGLVPLPSYFSSEWSFAQFRLQEESYAIVGFGQQANTLLVVSMCGSFFKLSFDPVRGGPCTQQSYCSFLDLEATR
ncbi:unnamed protein product [Ostreobium quekettii]|uniref:WD repeat domain phosphoinositide-interacting protein 3 n=1 Tax=Ostreobium quekettii TaxID=121088 RepID=A0A8S1J3E7_9CHLO|nr:unnamed protein product [Ostreobium quekettii]|eukprot:evm.model.scf_84.9 EVM.evm.TU.scf_84.9   scf_84:107140-111539(+)